MNRSRLLMIGGLALALGLLVSYTVYNRLLNSSNTNNEPGVDVVVAVNDLQVGAKLEGRDIRVARFPQIPNCKEVVALSPRAKWHPSGRV